MRSIGLLLVLLLAEPAKADLLSPAPLPGSCASALQAELARGLELARDSTSAGIRSLFFRTTVFGRQASIYYACDEGAVLNRLLLAEAHNQKDGEHLLHLFKRSAVESYGRPCFDFEALSPESKAALEAMEIPIEEENGVLFHSKGQMLTLVLSSMGPRAEKWSVGLRAEPVQGTPASCLVQEQE